jgi:tRNA wybutosine-synthesizing protein 2
MQTVWYAPGINPPVWIVSLPSLLQGDSKGSRLQEILTRTTLKFAAELRKLVATDIPAQLHEELPRKWSRVGSVAILNLEADLMPFRLLIGESVLEILSRNQIRTVAARISPPTEVTRLPSLEVIAGSHQTTTVHRELGCVFNIDPLKVTFSPGNHFERLRLIRETRSDSCLVDMFSCVGNLSLAPAVHNQSLRVFGVEINPIAFDFLRMNVRANKVEDRFTCIVGDNRVVTPSNVADRVILGFWGSDAKQMEAAVGSLKQDTGGCLHYHFLKKARHRKDTTSPIDQLLPMIGQKGMKLSAPPVLRHVKWVAACLSHAVLDISIRPA